MAEGTTEDARERRRQARQRSEGQISINSETYERLRAKSIATGVPMTDIVEQALAGEWSIDDV